MAETRELARLLAMGRPSQIPFASLESIEDPLSYSHRVKKGALVPGTNRVWMKSPGFEAPEVDFKALRKAGKAEPLFRRRATRYQNLIWKNGYSLNTDDPNAKNYVLSRMEVFAVLAGESFDLFLRKVSRELIMFDNCIIWERRVKPNELKKLGINLTMRGIGPLAAKGPVVCYEVLPIDTLEYKRDESGNITQWRQVNGSGKEKFYSPEEIIQLKNDEESGDILAYPALQMVLPDARILRQLETDASLTAHRLAFPVFKYKVGDPSLPETLPTDGDDLYDVWNALEGMLLEGALIISGADEFEVVLSDVKMDGMSQILEYFKNRVIVGLGLSPHHVGDVGMANRSIADRLDVQLYDDVKAFQKTMSDMVTFYIISKWLMEGGFNLKFGEEGISPSRVALTFAEIDTDSLIKRQNQSLQNWVQDGITHDELRTELGLTSLGDDTSGLYSDKIGTITAKHQQTVDKARAQASGGGAGQGNNAKTKAKKTSSTESVLEDIRSFKDLNLLFSEEIAGGLSRVKTDSVWNRMLDDITDYVRTRFKDQQSAQSLSATELKYISALYLSDLEESIRLDIVRELQDGLDRGFDEARAINPDVSPMRLTLFNRHANNMIASLRYYLNSLLNDVFTRVEREVHESDIPYLGVEMAFEALHYRLDSIVATHLTLANNWGVCIVAQHAGYDRVWQESTGDCHVCKSGWKETEGLRPQGVPPFSTHPHCGCKVHIRL